MVMLLGAIEEASPALFNLFLQAFDEGWLTNGHGRRAYLSNAMLLVSRVGRIPAVVMCIACCGTAVPLSAQGDHEEQPASLLMPIVDFSQVVGQPAGPPPTPRHTGVKAMMKDLVSDVAQSAVERKSLLGRRRWRAGTRRSPCRRQRERVTLNSDFAKNFFVLGKYLGALYTLLPAAVTVYTVGRAKDQPKVSHVGMDLIQSLLISEALVQTLKYTTQRERPDGSDKHSFPSGHAADTFAFATALERHLGWKGAVPAYIFSSYVAISRLPDNKHWLSDAVFGASVGIIAGRTVTRHGRDFPVTVVAVPGGGAIMYVRRSH